MTAPVATRQGGFTLLEILVALVVFGFLVIGLAQGTHFGLRVWRVQAATIRATGELDSTDRLLRSLVARMNPGTDLVPPEIIGTPHAMAFTSQIDDPATGVPQAVDVALSVHHHALVLTVAPHLHAIRSVPAGIRRTVLLTGIADLSIRYWQSHVRGAPTGWVGRWQLPQLPELVRIHLAFRRGMHRHWPDIIAAPRIQVPD